MESKRISIRKRRLISVACMGFGILYLSSSLSPPAARAQWGQQKKNAPALKVDPASQEVPLPDIPTYTGKSKFVRGEVNQQGTATTYVQTYICQETPDQVLDWYKNCFSMYKWKESYASKYAVGGTKDKSSCNVQAHWATKTEKYPGRTVVTIDYNKGR